MLECLRIKNLSTIDEKPKCTENTKEDQKYEVTCRVENNIS